ncbi:hypothetical protein K7X08_022592 [Anisodus acutangulus]|uniref:Leucine-rich repeat-containing N-terminal plant-type domain-containing protein n=1 Tax=Anisodus acutangulus TaxID=402998 RepID=A0A9Q1MNC5_9SOLA|nr:hypothetical protein K7X08_022592 [Anisodus acutangulus]
MGKKRYKFYVKIPCYLLFFLLIEIAESDVKVSVVIRDGYTDDASVMDKLAKSLVPTPVGWSGNNVCKWPGVLCDSSGRVDSISLIGKSLGGQLPPDINQLSNLQSLNLQKNRLSGPLPPLSDLASLQDVHLDYNNFTSVPPNFLKGLTNLQHFSIDENPSLPPWTIPDSLTDSPSLTDFSAANANIIGEIPDIFGSLPSLENLRLSYNNITGSLPSSFAKSGIQNLVLNSQKFGLSGRIDVIGSMEQVTQVWIHVNKFSGPIPDLSGCINLIDLQLRDNSLTGAIPPSLTNLPKLANVSLQNNIFLGPMPGFKPSVQVSLGNTNHFCNPGPGPCDPQVTILIEVAGAVGCPMTIAESWSGNNPCNDWNYITCDAKGSVTLINFAKLNWVGIISPAVANLTGLKQLLMNDNNLTGPIPANLASLTDLQIVDVSNNNISGKVPKFRSDVIVKTSGNPFIGKDLPPSSSGGTDYSPSASKDEKHKSSVSTWVILAIVIAAVFLILVLCLVIYKKKHKGKSKLSRGKEQKLKNGSPKNVNSYGAIPSTTSQSSAANSEIYVYDGGNVTIPVELLREATNNFNKENILGRGGFGIVYKGKLHDGTEIAVKRMEASIASNKATGRVTTKIDVFAFGVILMEILTGRKALDENLPEDRSHLVPWFKKMVVNKDKILEVLDPTLDPDEETYQSICKVVELAGHCAAREPSQRPDMGHTVNVLAPLVEQWTPTAATGGDSFNIDFNMSLPQALQRWTANDDSMLSEDTYGDYTKQDKNTFSYTKEHQ